MSNDTLNAQELLNACISKYSLVKIDGYNCYNFPAGVEFYGSTAMIDGNNNFWIVGDYGYNHNNTVNCIGWNKYTTLEDAYKHLDYLLDKLSRFELTYKNQLESKRLKKIKDDF